MVPAGHFFRVLTLLRSNKRDFPSEKLTGKPPKDPESGFAQVVTNSGEGSQHVAARG
jgi:hypothetical protein